MFLKSNDDFCQFCCSFCLKKLSFLFLYFTVMQIPNVTSYNVITNNPKYITDDSNNATNYFGFTLNVKATLTQPPEVTFLVGSPKSGSTTNPIGSAPSLTPSSSEIVGPGGILSCPITFNNITAPCYPVGPLLNQSDAKSLPGRDSLGLSKILSPPGPNLTVCSPLRMRNCSSGYVTYGVCYSSNDKGRTWAADTKQADSKCPVEDLDLIFLLDGSGSVTVPDPLNFDRVKQWVKNVTDRFDISTFANIGVIQYSHYYETRTVQPYMKVEIGLGQYKTQAEFQMAVDSIQFQGFTTFTAHALNRTVEEFMNSTRFSDPTTRKVIVLLTDGQSNDREFLEETSAYARGLGITIFAVGVEGYSEEELQIITSGELGNNDRVFGLDTFSDLNKVVDSLQLSITGVLEGTFESSENNGLQQAELGFSGVETMVTMMSSFICHLFVMSLCCHYDIIFMFCLFCLVNN
ncbi:integrin alpha-D-like [Ciona intestinalis]